MANHRQGNSVLHDQGRTDVHLRDLARCVAGVDRGRAGRDRYPHPTGPEQVRHVLQAASECSVVELGGRGFAAPKINAIATRPRCRIALARVSRPVRVAAQKAPWSCVPNGSRRRDWRRLFTTGTDARLPSDDTGESYPTRSPPVASSVTLRPALRALDARPAGQPISAEGAAGRPAKCLGPAWGSVIPNQVHSGSCPRPPGEIAYDPVVLIGRHSEPDQRLLDLGRLAGMSR